MQPRRHQAGYAMLASGIFLLLLVSLAGAYSARTGLLDIRNVADHQRHAEALSLAEANLHLALARLNLNRADLDPAHWQGAAHYGVCDGGLSLPCGDGNTNRYGNSYRYVCLDESGADVACNGNPVLYLLAQLPAAGTAQTRFEVVARGASRDMRAEAVVRQSVAFLAFDRAAQLPAPLLSKTGVTLGAGIQVVARSDGAGTGHPLSVWSAGTIALSGSAVSCLPGTFAAHSNACPQDNTQLSGASNGQGADMIGLAGNFPADLLHYVFGVTSGDYRALRMQAIPLADCHALNANTTGIVWVVGTCDLAGDIGGSNSPVMLVVESGALQAQAGGTFHGLIFTFATDGGHYDIQLGNGFTLHGALVHAGHGALTLNGDVRLIHSPQTLAALLASPRTMRLAEVDGGWADFVD